MADRRAQRRMDTIHEIVDIALDLMADNGAAGLTLGAIAKRLGMQTPSLYSYFDSKAALCDEIFRRGWAEIGAHMMPARERLRTATHESFPDDLRFALQQYVAWALRHRAYAEIMFWRTIPGWAPTDEAMKALVDDTQTVFEAVVELTDAGVVRGDPSEMASLFAVLTTGIITLALTDPPNVVSEFGQAQYLDRVAQVLVNTYAASADR